MKVPAILFGAVLLAGAATPVLADSPRAFLDKALAGDNSEIMLGRLAADRGRDPGVREFGNTLVSDHEQARREVLDVGRRFGIRPDREPSPEARAMRDHLMGLRGREFDQVFVRHMVDDHRKDIDEFRDEAREHHGPVSALASRQLPTLEKHLHIAQGLEGGRDDDRSDRRWRHR